MAKKAWGCSRVLFFRFSVAAGNIPAQDPKLIAKSNLKSTKRDSKSVARAPQNTSGAACKFDIGAGRKGPSRLVTGSSQVLIPNVGRFGDLIKSRIFDVTKPYESCSLLTKGVQARKYGHRGDNLVARKYGHRRDNREALYILKFTQTTSTH